MLNLRISPELVAKIPGIAVGWITATVRCAHYAPSTLALPVLFVKTHQEEPDRGRLVTVSTENPYKSPQMPTDDLAPSGVPAQVDWKSILKRWEILRIPYNSIVGLAGILVLAMFPSSFLPSALGGAVLYGICANVLFLLGPITELYVNWFVDAWENRLVPRWAATLVRARYLTVLLFVGGCLFSVGLTFAIGLAEAFGLAVANQ